MVPSPRSERWLPPTPVPPVRLKHDLAIGAEIAILDVREQAAFEREHIPGSIHAPDSQPAGLMRKVGIHRGVVLVCDSGKMSAMVARTLKFAGIADPRYLEGGIDAWAEAGGPLVEISATGQEHRRTRESSAESAARRLAPVARAINRRVLFMGLAAASAILLMVLLAFRA